MTPQERAQIKQQILLFVANHPNHHLEDVADHVGLDLALAGALVRELQAENRLSMHKKR